MASTPDVPLRRLFNESLAATLERHDTSLGIDRDGWLNDADDHFQRQHSPLIPILERDAIAAFKRQIQDEFIRKSRDPRIESERELTRIARAAQIEPGQYIAKRVVDCSRRELRLLAEQYERRARGMLRRAAFYRTVDRQLDIAGINEHETLRDWISRQAQ
jgi:formyltetrahydrofolate synthetase